MVVVGRGMVVVVDVLVAGIVVVSTTVEEVAGLVDVLGSGIVEDVSELGMVELVAPSMSVVLVSMGRVEEVDCGLES